MHNSAQTSFSYFYSVLQSRVGPVEWLKPYTDDTIVELGQKDVRALLAVPIRYSDKIVGFLLLSISANYSFVSEHIETLEEIDVEYSELALKSGIKEWGRVPALGVEPTFISDLADAVIETRFFLMSAPWQSQSSKHPRYDKYTNNLSLNEKGSTASRASANESLVPLGSVEELLAAYDSQRRELPPPVTVWECGWTKSAETWNGRAAMLAVFVLLVLEVTTGEGFLHHWGQPLFHWE